MSREPPVPQRDPSETGARHERFVVRGAAEGFRVIDIWTGETAVIAMTPQDGMTEEDARHTAGLLNRRDGGGDRAILQ